MGSNETGPQTHRQIDHGKFWRQIWRGTGGRGLGCGGLLGTSVLLLLVGLLYQLALRLLRLTGSHMAFGWIALIASAALLLLALYIVARSLLRFGLRNSIIAGIVLFLITTAIVGFTVPTGLSGAGHWQLTAQRILGWSAGGLHRLWGELTYAPEQLRFATTGRRSPLKYPDSEWEAGQPPPPIIVRLDSAGNSLESDPSVVETTQSEIASPAESSTVQVGNSVATIQTGGHVQVLGTDGQRLNGRLEPARNAAVVAHFSEGSSLDVLDGPVEADGLIWWKVRSNEGEGWCSADFLTPVE